MEFKEIDKYIAMVTGLVGLITLLPKLKEGISTFSNSNSTNNKTATIV